MYYKKYNIKYYYLSPVGDLNPRPSDYLYMYIKV